MNNSILIGENIHKVSQFGDVLLLIRNGTFAIHCLLSLLFVELFATIIIRGSQVRDSGILRKPISTTYSK